MFAALGEVRQEVFEAIGGEEVRDLVGARGGGVSKVDVKVAREDGGL